MEANRTSPKTKRLSRISYDITLPEVETEKRYVTIKYFPTGNDEEVADSGHPSPSSISGDTILTRSFRSPDADRRTIVISAKRTVLPSTDSQNDDSISEVVGTQNEVFVEQHSPGVVRRDLDGEVQRLLSQLRRDRQEKSAVRWDSGEPPAAVDADRCSESSARSWTTRDNLRASCDSADSGIASSLHGDRAASGPETMTSRILNSLARLADESAGDGRVGRTDVTSTRSAADDLERLMLRYEPGPIPKTATRLPTYVPRDPKWENISHEIIESEIGEVAMLSRLEKQLNTFQAGARKGGIFESVPLTFHNWKIRGLFEKKAKELRDNWPPTGEVGALGYAVVLKNDNIPENDFFVPERVFEIRAKHSSFPPHTDDQKAAWRSLSLKFQDHDYESPFDLVLHSGRSSPFYNVQSLEDFHVAYDKGPAALKQHLCSLPVYLEAVIEGVRKDIGSYTSVHYYSHVTYDFKAKDGKRRVARFRVVACDASRDGGRLKPEEQRELWYKMMMTDEKTEEKQGYLAAEWRHRIEEASLTYSLQIQIGQWKDGDTYALYNPSRAWDEAEAPWHDLARIRLLSVLADDILHLTSFNPGNLPEDTLGFPEPTSTSDFNVIPYIYTEGYKVCFKILPHDPPVLPPGEGVEYLIHVVTADHEKAGIQASLSSDCHVYICLIGSDDRTPFVRLDRKTKNDFAKGTRSTFTIRQRFVGDLLCVKIYKTKSNGQKSDWLLDYVVVSTTYNSSCYLFPCGRWFNNRTPLHQLRTGTPCLLEKESSFYLRRQRQAEVTFKQQEYRWHDHTLDLRYVDLPGFLEANDDFNEIPLNIRSEHGQQLLDEWNGHLRGKNSAIKKIRDFFWPRRWKGKTLEDACRKEVADALPESGDYRMLNYVMKSWKSDVAFSRQILNGVMPERLRQLKEIPSSFPITDDITRYLRENGTSLEEQLKAGQLYMVSYPELEPFAAKQLAGDKEQPPAGDKEQPPAGDKEQPPAGDKGKEKEGEYGRKYLCAPMVLFWLKDGRLSPLAIQLSQRPAVDPVVYTPNDDEGDFSDWQMAKLWVRVAESNFHQFVGRLLSTNLLLEPIAIAVIRNLPDVHPVSRLLYPCLRDVITVNTIYRKCVLPEDGALAEVMAVGQNGIRLLDEAASDLGSLAALNPTEVFVGNGTLDHCKLPEYHYRDDCLALWEAVRDFVIDIVCLHYDDDEQVEGDAELDTMLRDLDQNGFHGSLSLPERLASIEQLVLFCTTVLFQASVRHTAYTRGMIDMYAFCLSAPPCLMRAPPEVKRPEGYTVDYVDSLLPPSDLQERYINAMLLMLGGLKKPKMTLGHYPDGVFTEEKAIIAMKGFQKQLRGISNNILQRHSQLDEWNYDYLLPENIPAGIMA